MVTHNPIMSCLLIYISILLSRYVHLHTVCACVCAYVHHCVYDTNILNSLVLYQTGGFS